MSLPITSIASMLTNYIRINKSNKSKSYFINNNYKVQRLDFLLNEPLNLEIKREESDKGTQK